MILVYIIVSVKNNYKEKILLVAKERSKLASQSYRHYQVMQNFPSSCTFKKEKSKH